MAARDCYRVAYRYRTKPGGSWNRVEKHGNVTQTSLPPVRSETGVLAILRRLHPSAGEILIERLTWDGE